MTPFRRASEDQVARTRMLWATNKPTETTAAPAYVPEPPALWLVGTALFVTLLVQATLAPFIALHGAAPSFVTLVVAWYGVRTGSVRGLAGGLVAGACEDALAGMTGLAWTFATGLAGFLAGRVARTWLADTKVALVPLAFAITLVRYVAFAALMAAQHRPQALPFLHLRGAVLQSALDATLTLAILYAFPVLGGNANRR